MQIELNNIYNISCEYGIQALKESGTKVDCIITSPPYNVDLGDNKFNKNPYDLYKDNKNHWEYIKWLKSIFSSCQDILNVGANICINIGDGTNGNIPTHSDIMQFMSRDLNFIPITTIIWNKANCSNRTSWGSWRSPSNMSFPTPFEYILVFRYLSREHPGDKDAITVSSEEFVQNSLALWEFGTEKLSKIGHPACFPEELPKRLIQQLTYRGEIIFDPFMGSGTVASVAKGLGRKYLGFELSPQYYQLSLDRVNNTVANSLLPNILRNNYTVKLF